MLTVLFYRNYKCKHIVAVLLHINAAKTFDKLSPTDQPQKWGKEHKERVKQKYEPRAIVDLPCAKKVCKYIGLLKLSGIRGQTARPMLKRRAVGSQCLLGENTLVNSLAVCLFLSCKISFMISTNALVLV